MSSEKSSRYPRGSRTTGWETPIWCFVTICSENNSACRFIEVSRISPHHHHQVSSWGYGSTPLQGLLIEKNYSQIRSFCHLNKICSGKSAGIITAGWITVHMNIQIGSSSTLYYSDPISVGMSIQGTAFARKKWRCEKVLYISTANVSLFAPFGRWLLAGETRHRN